MKPIICKVGDLQPSQKNKTDMVLPKGKVIIVAGATSAVAGKPKHFEVVIEITREADRVRFGKITAVTAVITEEEKVPILLSEAIQNLAKEFGELPFPLFKKEGSETYLFTKADEFYKGGIFDPAVKWGYSSPLDPETLRNLYQKQVGVENQRNIFFNRAVAAFESARKELLSIREKYMGLLDCSAPFLLCDMICNPPLRGDLALSTEFFNTQWPEKTIPWTEEGTEKYEACLHAFVQEREKWWRESATKRILLLTEKVKAGWVLGEYEVIYAGTTTHDAYHSNPGSAGEGYEFVAQKRGLRPLNPTTKATEGNFLWVAEAEDEALLGYIEHERFILKGNDLTP